MKFRLQPQKKNSITKKNSVSFTNRRWPTPNYNVCCVTRQYLFRIHFFASQRLSEGPACLYNYICLLHVHFFFSNTSCSKISVTLDQDDLPASITWQKERARTVLISEFPAPSPAINTNLLRQFRLSKLEERMNKNKQHKVGRRKDPISTTITLCWYFLFFSLLHEDGFFGFVLVSRWVQVHNIHGIIMFLLVTRNFLPLCPV